jgi:hypothetical protein
VIQRRRRTLLSEAIIIAALMLLPLLFWWRLWALDPADRAVIPSGDFTDQYYPLQLFAARELDAGRLPAWDPYINAGQPGLADIQTGFFYPLNLMPNLIRTLLGLEFSIGFLTAQVVLHYALASLFTYLLVRHLTRRAGARLAAARFAGAISALTFTYSGYLTTFPVQQLTILQTAIWLPLVLLFLDRAFYRPNRLSQVILAGLALACALLAGHPQTSMYVIYTVLAYGLFLAWSTRRAERETPNGEATPRRHVGRSVALLLMLFALGLALAAIQLAPALRLIVRSTRAELHYGAVAWGFPLTELTHLLYPGYFGGSPQYVGILSPILAVAALFVKRARHEVVFWLVFGILALILALGGNTFLYNVTYLLAPGFGAVRNQERIIYLFSLSVSVLAGYGGLTLVQPLTRSQRKGFSRFSRGLTWLWVAFLALTVVYYFGYLQGLQQGVEINLFEGLLRHHLLLLMILGGSALLFVLRRTGRVRRKWLMVLALALIWLNLFTVNWRFNLADPVPGGLYPESGIVAFLKQQPGVFRISSAGHLPGGASAGIVYELEDITGNTPLRLDAFQQLEDRLGSWRRWQLLNVRYVLSRKRLEGPGLEQVYGEGGVKVYHVGDPLPRAWVVHNTVVADGDQAIDLLNADSFDPRSTAVLTPEDKQFAVVGGGGPTATTEVLLAAPGRLDLEVSSSEDSLLVVSQPFHPGWQAEVEGKPAHVLRANYLLQGIPIQAGKQRVELRYHLSPLPAILSLASLVACLIVLVIGLRRT